MVETGLEGSAFAEVDRMVEQLDAGGFAELGKDGSVSGTAAIVNNYDGRDGA